MFWGRSMAQKTIPAVQVVPLSDMAPNQEADLFALLSARQELVTRDGKPYYRVTFRDARREVSFPIWNDSPWAENCRRDWAVGAIYKLRAIYRETNYGPQLDLKKVREATDDDRDQGFDPAMFRERSRYDAAEMHDALVKLIDEHVQDAAVRDLVRSILIDNRQALLDHPAARRNHHAFVAGLLEHTLSVTRTCVFLAEKYADYYPDMKPPLDKDLVVAGGALHDIGKLRELQWLPEGADYTASGNLVGHILQGRDMLREAAAGRAIDAEKLLRLEHVIVSHQRLPEFGSPKPPMTCEATLVHYADDIDAKFFMLQAILRDDTQPGVMTSKKNVLGQPVYRGG